MQFAKPPARVHDPDYLRWVKGLPCAAPRNHSCVGPVEAHHAGERGVGRKADDTTAIPLCTLAHRDWHGATGCFRGWTRETRKAWAWRVIAETRATIEERKAGTCTQQG